MHNKQWQTLERIEIRELKWFGYLMRIEQEFSYKLFGHRLGRGNEEGWGDRGMKNTIGFRKP